MPGQALALPVMGQVLRPTLPLVAQPLAMPLRHAPLGAAAGTGYCAPLVADSAFFVRPVPLSVVMLVVERVYARLVLQPLLASRPEAYWQLWESLLMVLSAAGVSSRCSGRLCCTARARGRQRGRYDCV